MENLLHRRRELMNHIQQLQRELRNLEKNIRLYKKTHGEQCASCGRYNLSSEMWIAEQSDIESYLDCGEGYAGPTIGEFYCGC